MLKYSEFLTILGIEASHADRLAQALDQLHLEICALDKESRRIFYQRSLDERMTDFSEIEELIDPKLS